jgi:hypothetical protein
MNQTTRAMNATTPLTAASTLPAGGVRPNIARRSSIIEIYPPTPEKEKGVIYLSYIGLGGVNKSPTMLSRPQ